MKIWNKNKKNINKIDNNRVNLILAIIFLLVGSILFKLFNLQILKHDWYMMLASNQHQILNQLEPSRGRIFLQDEPNNTGDNLYPVATNKNYALVYAIPKDIDDKNNFAEQLYNIFKSQQIEKEVEDKLVKEEEDNLKKLLEKITSLNEEDKKIKEAEIIKNNSNLLLDKKYQEIRQIKKEAEIKLRKEQAINDYLYILNKKDDPYEPLEQKVEENILKKLYIGLAGLEAEFLEIKDLEVKDNKIFYNFNKNNQKEKKKELIIEGLGFLTKTYRFYPEDNIGANLLGFVNYINEEQHGHYGLEGFFDQELFGKYGSLKAERDAKGDITIIDDRQYIKPQNGSDIILTINRTIQFNTCKKLNEAVLKHGADGGSVIIMNHETGAILAMCSYPDYDPNNYNIEKNIKVFNNPTIFSQYEPGSIFKVITMAISLDQEKITPQTSFEDTGQVKIANYTIENSDQKAHGVVTMIKVLEESLNTGAIFAMRQVGPDTFENYLKMFGFGEKTGIELEGESRGDINNLIKEKKTKIKELNAATASFGQGIAVTPLQMVSAFAAIANGGKLMKPFIVKEIIRNDGSRIITEPIELRRVISEKTATILSGMMVNVVENGHGKKAGVKGYWVAGKTGTAQVPKQDGRGYQPNAHIGSFAGFAPVEDPYFTMLVRIDQPRDVEWAESSAAPLFGELAQFILNYWQVPKTR